MIKHQREAHRFRERIRLRPPFDGDRLLAFLAARAVPGVERVDGRTYARCQRLARSSGIIRLSFPSPGDPLDHVQADLTLGDPADRDDAMARCRRLLDADCDPEAVAATLGADPQLRQAVRSHPGIRVPGALSGSELLVRAILGQQISVAAARTAAGRLAFLGGERPAVTAPGLELLFPSPATLVGLGAEAISGPRRRAAALMTAVTAVAAGTLLVEPGRTTTELTEDLVSLPGIGPWTAGYVAMRVLGDKDVLLTGDLVLRQGAAALGLPDDPRALARRGERWAPYRSYAGMLLWSGAPAAQRVRSRASS